MYTKREKPMKTKKKRILIIYTGGTIGMMKTFRDG